MSNEPIAERRVNPERRATDRRSEQRVFEGADRRGDGDRRSGQERRSRTVR